MNDKQEKNCNCAHHFIIPTLIFLIGITILLGNLELIMNTTVGLLWPTFLALIGLQKMFSHKCKCYSTGHHCQHDDASEHR